jgi:DNA-binding IclR family transcriptional regulator
VTLSPTWKLSIAGYSVLRLASALLDTDQLRLESLPYLERLAQSCGERASLGIIHQNQLLSLAGVEKPNLPMIYSRFGKTSPAYCRSWQSDPRELGRSSTRELPQCHGPGTQDREHHHRSRCLAAAAGRDQGAGICLRLRRAHCLASPIAVRSEVVGAIGATGRSKEALKPHIQTVQHTAEVISHILSRGS